MPVVVSVTVTAEMVTPLAMSPKASALPTLSVPAATRVTPV